MPGAPIDRRELLRLGALGAGAFLAACSSGGSSRAVARRAPVAPDAPWWLRGDFAPVTKEVETHDLVVRGRIPKDLSGLYVRNGSNPLTGRSPHWFLGDGMVHGVLLANGGAAWYRNRYVQTSLLAAGGGLTAAGAPGGAAGLSNVSLVHHAGKLLSLGEVGLPYEVSPRDLSTVGVYDFAGALTGNMTAHPKIDPATGYLHFFGYEFTAPYLRYHVADASGALVSTQPVDVKASTMIHDFAITERDVVFWECPVLFDMQLALKMVSDPSSKVMPFVWKPEYGARVGVMPLGGPTSAIRWVELDEPCYVFHGVNAYRDGENVVIDVCRMPKVFDGPALGPPPRLHRWTVDTSGPSLSLRDDVVSDTIGDLPSIDRRRAGRPYRYGYRVEVRRAAGTVDLGGVLRHDTRTGREQRWDPGQARSSGEWFFVPSGDGEGEGYLLAFVYDRRDDTSELVILDAGDVTAGPLASVALPQRVPYGFHAAWVPATEV